MKDTLFQDPGRRGDSFKFDEDVALVFNDMLKRSIPFYFEIQNMIADLVERLAPDNGKICDLGCSTGNTIALLSKRLKEKSIQFEGIDNSVPMLKEAKKNLEKLNKCDCQLNEQDLNEGARLSDADIVIMNLVMQFVRPDSRVKLIDDIFSGLNKNGCLILVEKLVVADQDLENIFTDAYLSFKKRNLYTDQEIALKRKALENVLVPYRLDENIKLLRNAGFKKIEVFFRWFNFCGLVAIK